MKSINNYRVLLTVMFLFAVNTAHAHNALTKVLPSDQSVISESPKSLELTFSDETYLEEIELETASGDVVPLNFEPSITASRHFSVPVPAISDGEYHVKWQVVGDDTHKISGEYTFKLQKTLE